MLKSLGIEDDDSADVVIHIEKAFDISIPEAPAIYTVGEMFDVLRRKLPNSDANRKCASAMAFYRIRRALIDFGLDVARSPSTDLSGLDRVYTKTFAKNLEMRSGLRLPRPALGLIGRLGSAAVITGVLSIVVAGLGMFGLLLSALLAMFGVTFVSPTLAHWFVKGPFLVFVAGATLGCLLWWIDAGRLPSSCRTLGALASKAAVLSYGRLVKEGADGSDTCLWKALVDILSDYAAVPADQIAPETYFLASTLKTRSAA
jgi:hypothetical protein